ncbi:MAG: hypothetical protein IJ174_04030 [Clostridia bacterium]|nr:hypothetical protein [Clostridia bacterium]MBQ8136581.1 hypothetical protein [Clostridia bacterium]
MDTAAYGILALFMRYVFVLLSLLILLGVVRSLLSDRAKYRREMKRMPDAGYVGKWVDLDSGQVFLLQREGTIGTARQADVRLSGQGLAAIEAHFAFENGKGLRIIPERGRLLVLDGMPIEGSVYALNGSELQVGNTVLSLRLLAGLPVPQGRRAAVPEMMEDGEWIEVMPLPVDHIEGDLNAVQGQTAPYDEDGRGEMMHGEEKT